MIKIVPFNNYAEIANLKNVAGMSVEVRVLDVGGQINLATGDGKKELDGDVDSAGNLNSGQPWKDTDGVKVYSPFADILYARGKGTGTSRGVKVDVLIYRRTP